SRKPRSHMDRWSCARADREHSDRTRPAKRGRVDCSSLLRISNFKLSTLRSTTKTACRNFVKPLSSYTCKLTGEQAVTLKSWLQTHHYKFREVPYARFAAEKEKTNVVFYESGKLVVQGKGTREFIEFVLEPEILKEARLGYEAVLNPELLLPRLGVDESGKGDFVGPPG